MAKKNDTAPATSTETPVAAEAPATPAVVKVTQNGITRPKDGTTTGRVWAIADEISSKLSKPADRKSVIEQVVAEQINASTGATQYGKWRKFHGLVGEAAPGRTPAPAPAVETPAADVPAAPEAPTAPVVEG